MLCRIFPGCCGATLVLLPKLNWACIYCNLSCYCYCSTHNVKVILFFAKKILTIKVSHRLKPTCGLPGARSCINVNGLGFFLGFLFLRLQSQSNEINKFSTFEHVLSRLRLFCLLRWLLRLLMRLGVKRRACHSWSR